MNLFTVWKIHQYICLTAYKFPDFFEAETLVLRNGDVSNVWPKN